MDYLKFIDVDLDLRDSKANSKVNFATVGRAVSDHAAVV